MTGGRFHGVVLAVSLLAVQIGQNQIEGRLQAPSGFQLPENTRVILKEHTGSAVAMVAAGSNGRFSFTSLAAGKYVIAVQADGFFPAEEAVEIPSGFFHNVINVVISLRPREESDRKPSRREKSIPIDSLAIPRSAVQEVEKAEKAAAQGKLEEAIRHAEKAFQLVPRYFQACNNLAVYYYQWGDKKKSVELFQQALAIHEEAAGTHSNLARVYLDLSRPDLALRHLRRAVELDPSSATHQYYLGRAYILLGQLALSVEPLSRALELDPPVEHARFLLAHVFYELGQKGEAVRELEAYVATDPRDRKALEERLRQWKAELNPPRP